MPSALGRVLGVWCVLLCLPRLAGTEIFPLSEVRAGQEGVWRTVIEGQEIKEFPLRILGVLDNFIGPRQPAIIAEALDPDNLLSGPVAGMSGSPVYIDGRLVGAYAYGYVWPKEQAIIGITPIEGMLPLLETRDQLPPGLRGLPGRDPQPMERRSGGGELAQRPSRDDFGAVLTPLPTPLGLSGFRASTIEAFRGEWEALGLAPVSGAGGMWSSASTELEPVRPLDLRPGAVIAGVLMAGDFSAAATGTITYVSGNKLLGFGHPFLQEGEVAMPLAGAEVLTVVRNLRSSFKLSRVGQMEGTLRQDRLTGVAGEVGPLPPMIDLAIEINKAEAPTVHYSARVWPHMDYFPLLTAMAMLEGLGDVLGREGLETVTSESQVHLRNGQMVTLRGLESGSSAANNLAVGTLQRLRFLANNPFGPLDVERVTVSLQVEAGERRAGLREVRLGDTRPRIGGTLPVWIEYQDELGDRRSLTVDLPLPTNARRGDTIQLLVSDAATANRALGLDRVRRTANNFQDWVAPFGEGVAADAIHFLLLRDHAGPEIAGQALPGLPPSVQSSLRDPATTFVTAELPPTLLHLESIPVGAPVVGSHRLTVTLD